MVRRTQIRGYSLAERKQLIDLINELGNKEDLTYQNIADSIKVQRGAIKRKLLKYGLFDYYYEVKYKRYFLIP